MERTKNTMNTPTKHTCNNGFGPSFGKKTTGCPRCDELLAGAPARQWRGVELKKYNEKVDRLYREAHAIRHANGECGVVCTAMEW